MLRDDSLSETALKRNVLTVLCWRVGVFLMIFAPVLNIGLGAFGDTLSLLCLWLVLYYLNGSRSKPTIVLPEIKNLALLLVLTIGYGILGALLFSSEQGSIQVALRPLRALIMLSGVYVFVLAYANRFKENFSEALLYDIFLAISAHALIMIAEFVFPEFRNALYPYTYADQVIEYNQQFRMAGLTNGGGSQLSLFQSVGLLLWPLVLLNHTSTRQKIVSTIFALCIAASLLLSGRSGIILSLLMLPLVIFLSQKNGFRHLMASGAKAIVLVAVLVGAMYVASSMEIDGLEDWAYAEQAVNRSTDFLSSNEPLMQHAVVEDLEGMLLIPEDAKTLVIGDPYLFDASYMGENRVVQSDIGYIVFLFGYGLLGSLLQYAFYVLILWYSIRYWPCNRSLALMSFVWALAVLIFQAKEVLVFSRMGFSMTTMFIVALAVEHARSFLGNRKSCVNI